MKGLSQAEKDLLDFIQANPPAVCDGARSAARKWSPREAAAVDALVARGLLRIETCHCGAAHCAITSDGILAERLDNAAKNGHT